jgi:hypothetical protein
MSKVFIYLAIPPPGMKTVSPSSPVPRPDEDPSIIYSNNIQKYTKTNFLEAYPFESFNDLKMLFENTTKRQLGLPSENLAWRKILGLTVTVRKQNYYFNFMTNKAKNTP